MSTPAGNFSYQYDASGRPVSVTNPFSETSTFTYLDNDWLLGQRLGNGVNTSYTYNARGSYDPAAEPLSGKRHSGGLWRDRRNGI